MDTWRSIEIHQNEGESENPFEHLKVPYTFAINDEWEELKRYFKMHPQKLICPMAVNGDTAFHIAASCVSQGKKLLEFFVSLLSTYKDKCDALRLQNYNGNNTLHEAALSGNLEAAEFLVTHFNKPAADAIPSTDDRNATLPLLETRNHLGETSLYRAAAFGRNKMLQFFAHKVENPDHLHQHFHRIDKMSILHMAVIAQHFETSLWLQTNYEYLAKEVDNEGLTSLQLLAQMPNAFVPRCHRSKWQMLIYHCLPVNYLDTPNRKDDPESSLNSNLKDVAGWLGNIINKIWRDKRNKRALHKLIHLLVEKDYSGMNSVIQAKTKTISLGSVENLMDDAGSGGKQGEATAESAKPDQLPRKYYDYTPLLIATITGIMPIVTEILKQHPQAAEHTSYDEQNILHLAIKYRHAPIYKLIKSKPTLMSRLKEGIDKNGNTILHQAADRSFYSISMSEQLIGPAMQLQAELRWMLRVEKIVPPHYIMHHNKKNQTAEELFNEGHDQLLESAQKWMKDTAQACSVVAVLVVSVVFAATYGFPKRDPESLLYWLFNATVVVAISCSLSSVALFLSILSSPLEYPHFCYSLPRKVLVGFILLFVSMLATVIAFAATILVVIRIEKKWTQSVFYAVAFFPVPLFGLMQFPVYQSVKVCLHATAKIFRRFFFFFFPLRLLKCITKNKVY